MATKLSKQLDQQRLIHTRYYNSTHIYLRGTNLLCIPNRTPLPIRASRLAPKKNPSPNIVRANINSFHCFAFSTSDMRCVTPPYSIHFRRDLSNCGGGLGVEWMERESGACESTKLIGSDSFTCFVVPPTARHRYDNMMQYIERISFRRRVEGCWSGCGVVGVTHPAQSTEKKRKRKKKKVE